MNVPAIDCKDDPVRVVVAARVEDEPLLIICKFPLIVVIPPRLTV